MPVTAFSTPAQIATELRLMADTIDPESVPKSNIGPALKVLRQELKIEPSDFAAASRLSTLNLNAIEQGDVTINRYHLAELLRMLLSCRVFPVKGMACLCPEDPACHDSECRIHAMCEQP